MTDPLLAAARDLLERTGSHPVLNVVFDLNPSEFATPPARTTEADALTDQAHKRIEALENGLSHEDKVTLVADLERLRTYLRSDELPVSGARALAVFVSGQDDVFVTVVLHDPAGSGIVISDRAHVEPLAVQANGGAWCVALVNERTARIFAGRTETADDRGSISDDVRGRSHGGGLSQDNYERSQEDEADHHYRRVAEELRKRLEAEPYTGLAIGGPEADVARFRELLAPEVAVLAVAERLSIDVATATEAQVREALEPLRAQRREAAEAAALDRLRAAQGGSASGRAESGIEATQLALEERRVQTLLLSPSFQATGDGGSDVRATAVASAVLQDATVLVFTEEPPAAHLVDGIGALLRY
jgi:hypothetical protein